MTGLRRGFSTKTLLLIALALFTRRAVGQADSAVATGASSSLPSLQPLLDFHDGDIKFNLQSLMTLLRDRNHEGWVLVAYPDPNTGLPLIGAGFSLDVAATEHPQRDPLNPNQFLEPSSTQLWQAAGVNPERLPEILGEFHRRLNTWGADGYRRRIRARALSPQITEKEATELLRISAIQAINNAKAYCRNFDQLSGPAQMALSQLTFQMGTNLEEFVEFLSELNGDTSHPDLSQRDGGAVSETEHWTYVQHTLVDSMWARRYTIRAISVIAMFDPRYGDSPSAAEARVTVMLPLPAPRRHQRSIAHHSQNARSRAKGGAHAGHPIK